MNITTKTWKELLLSHKSEFPVILHGESYATPYHFLYANLFPKRHDEIKNSTIYSLKEQRLSLEMFDEDLARKLLMEVIDYKYKNDGAFALALRKTKDRIIMSYEPDDFYFGHPRNIYGKALMKYKRLNSN